MIEISPSSYPNRFQDRAAYAQKLAEMRPGVETADEILKRTDAEDLEVLSGSESTAGYARGEGVILAIGDITLNMKDFQTHYDVYSGPVPTRPDGSSSGITALNVDFVVANQEKVYGHDLKGIVYYADYLQKTMEYKQQQDPGYTFTGYVGTDHLTHDVNEYIDLLYQKAGIERPANLADGMGLWKYEGVSEADPEKFYAVQAFQAARNAPAALAGPIAEALKLLGAMKPVTAATTKRAVKDPQAAMAQLRADMVKQMIANAPDKANALATIQTIANAQPDDKNRPREAAPQSAELSLGRT